MVSEQKFKRRRLSEIKIARQLEQDTVSLYPGFRVLLELFPPLHQNKQLLYLNVRAKLIAFPSGGFCGNYQWGIKKVFDTLLNKVVEPSTAKYPKTVNIIGPTTDTFYCPSDIAELKRLLDILDLKVHTFLSVNTDVNKIRTMANAALKIVIACPYDYTLGLVSFIKEQWGLKTDLVVFLVKPETYNAVNVIKKLGVSRILIEPENDELETLFKNKRFDVIFGNYHQLKIAEDIPIKYHVAFPSFDYINVYDGTPFVGFRGTAYLTQQLGNSINHYVEVIG